MLAVMVTVHPSYLSEAMANMRIWLDDRGINPLTFRYTRVADDAVQITATFVAEADGAAFAAAFGGEGRSAGNAAAGTNSPT